MKFQGVSGDVLFGACLSGKGVGSCFSGNGVGCFSGNGVGISTLLVSVGKIT